MAQPISPTPDLEGEDAIEFISEMKRIERGEFTAEEIEYRKEFKRKKESMKRIIRIGDRE